MEEAATNITNQEIDLKSEDENKDQVLSGPSTVRQELFTTFSGKILLLKIKFLRKDLA